MDLKAKQKKRFLSTSWMRLRIAALLLVAILLASSAPGFAAAEQNTGEGLFQQAQSLEAQKEYTQAYALYTRALPLLNNEEKGKLAWECALGAERMFVFLNTYPYSLQDVKEEINKAYPQAGSDEIENWLAPEVTERHFYDGEEHYFMETVSNLKYRYLELMCEDDKTMATYDDLAEKVIRLAEDPPAQPWIQYHKPATYRGTHIISIPRSELPEQGTYRLWLPIPINSGPQTNVIIESVTPAEWVKQPPSISEDIGLVYMDIPMEEVTGDLNIRAEFTFTHFEQSFRVDPSNVGEYDKDSALYQEYTRSSGNTEITPDIRAMAEKITDGETNPFLAARKLYDYIVYNVTYNLMPHSIFWPRSDLTESDYVHRNQRGDCGAQSMYFAAMCRALGIPARSTGGFQLFSGNFSGHFWAEFYLPNYGWIPVDTSFGQLALYPDNLSDKARQTFIDFCFASQDSMRCIVQKDTDVLLIPRARSMPIAPLAIQMPVAQSTVPTGDFALMFMDHWTIECEKITEE